MARRRRRTSRAMLWGLFGAGLLAVGFFAPIALSPGGTTITLLSAGSIPSRLILVAALSSAVLLLCRRRRALLLTGAFAGLMVLAEFLAFREDLAVVPAAGPFAPAVLSSFVGEWGWAPLTLGVGLLLLAGLSSGRHR